MRDKPEPDNNGQPDPLARPVYSLDEVLAIQLENLREGVQIMLEQLPELRTGSPSRLLHATWYLGRALRLLSKAWNLLDVE
jgi:hypothetical protein